MVDTKLGPTGTPPVLPQPLESRKLWNRTDAGLTDALDRAIKRVLEQPSNDQLGWNRASLTSGRENLVDFPSGPSDVDALSPISAEDIEAYRGRWVILYAGRVIADAAEPDDLFEDPRTRQGEYTLYWVPQTQRRFR